MLGGGVTDTGEIIKTPPSNFGGGIKTPSSSGDL